MNWTGFGIGFRDGRDIANRLECPAKHMFARMIEQIVDLLPTVRDWQARNMTHSAIIQRKGLQSTVGRNAGPSTIQRIRVWMSHSRRSGTGVRLT